MDKRNRRQWQHPCGGPVLALMFSLAVGCGGDDDARPFSSSGETPARTEASEDPTPNDDEAPGDSSDEGSEAEPATHADVRDLSGLQVSLNEDGTVDVDGTDRWGEAIDTQYTDHTYFRNAIPVLSRSVTPEQAAGLSALAAEFAAADGEGSEEAEEAEDGRDEPEEEEAD